MGSIQKLNSDINAPVISTSIDFNKELLIPILYSANTKYPSLVTVSCKIFFIQKTDQKNLFWAHSRILEPRATILSVRHWRTRELKTTKIYSAHHFFAFISFYHLLFILTAFVFFSVLLIFCLTFTQFSITFSNLNPNDSIVHRNRFWCLFLFDNSQQ